MSLPEDLAGFSREELIELVGRLFGHIQVLEARIAELEGQQKPPTGVKERNKAKPARPLQGERRSGTALSPPTNRPVAPTARSL